VLKLPIKDDVRKHPPIPRETRKWARLYRLRTAIERVNSRLKGLLGLGSITVLGNKAFIRGFFNFLMGPIYQDLPVSREACQQQPHFIPFPITSYDTAFTQPCKPTCHTGDGIWKYVKV